MRLTGRVDLVPGDDGRGTTVMVDGHPQSFVDLADPTHLDFPYLEAMAVVIDTLRPGPLAVTHVGGAGMSLARYVDARRPGSPQIVIEPDAPLTELIRHRLPLPRGHRIRVRATDGLTGLAGLATASADVVILDAFEGGRVPAELTTCEALGELSRVVAEDGVALLNLADDPGLRYLARVAVGLGRWLPRLAVIAGHEVLRNRRFGNAVVLGSRGRIDVEQIAARLARGSLRIGVRHGSRLAGLLGSARPLSSLDAVESPPPPPPNSWRRR